MSKYPATDGVGSGPFTLDKWVKRGSTWPEGEPELLQGAPAYDEIVLPALLQPDAMVAALKKGEIDAAHDVPNAFKSLARSERDRYRPGPAGRLRRARAQRRRRARRSRRHPALLDLRFRQAIAHAIDKKTLVDRGRSAASGPG